VDLRPGGRWRICFTSQDGESHEVGGTYETIDPHRRLVFSWAWHTTPERVSRVTVALQAVDGGTELELLHERFVDAIARDNHLRGWSATMPKLDALLVPA
jgi:uncharacterized protein YndB with AHSA1/START domain